MKKYVLLLLCVPIVGFVVLFLWVWGGDVYYRQQSSQNIAPAQVALVLSTLTYLQGKPNPCQRARVEAAVELWHEGKVRQLLMSGGQSHDGRYNAVEMGKMAEEMGVPKGDILLENRASSTYQNILFSTPLLESVHDVVLVSDAFHLNRAAWIAHEQWSGKQVQVFAGRYCYPSVREYVYYLGRETGALIKNGLLGRY